MGARMFLDKSWIARNVAFPIHARWESLPTHRYLKSLEDSQYWNRETLAELQVSRLRELLSTAYRFNAYWQNLMDDCGVIPERIAGLDDLKKMPIMTKSLLQSKCEELTLSARARGQLELNRTGGSTGQPVNFYVDRDRMAHRKAATIRHDRWTGWDLGQDIAYLWGRREDGSRPVGLLPRLRQTILGKALFLDTSSITVDKMREYNRSLLKCRPRLYVAYANSIHLFARFIREYSVSEYHRPRAIITSAEVLDDSRRELVQSVFECPVFNRYGSRETSVIASECNEHKGMHICSEALIVEIVSGGNSVDESEAGKVVVTDLRNVGTPLIRYEIGDVARLATDQCSCGRGLPLLEGVRGRVTDFIVCPDGRIVSGAALTIFLIANSPGIAQAQILQKQRGHIIVRLVRGAAYGVETERFLDREIGDLLGRDMHYELEFVDIIPSTSSGKYLFSISEIDPFE